MAQTGSNIGIGTTNPATLLEVSSPSDGGAIRITSTQNDDAHNTTIPFGSLQFYSTDISSPGAGIRGSINLLPFDNFAQSGSHLTFNVSSNTTSNYEAVRITNTGNVGIGTSTPTLGTLQISGNVYAISYTGSFSGSHVGNTTGTSSWAVSASSANTASYVITAQTASYVLQAVSASFATSAANATTASYVLQAVSASYASSSTSASYASTASYVANAFIQDGNSFGATATLGTNDAQSLAFETNGTTRMTISGSNGNVGIGTTSPGEKLSISGSVAITTGGSLKFGDVTTSINTFGLSHVNNTGLYLSVYKAGGGGILGTNSTDALVIRQDTGNVGIGTSTPTSGTLQVNGNIYATSFTGSLSGSHVGDTTGTASYATSASNAISASWAPTITYTFNNGISDIGSNTIRLGGNLITNTDIGGNFSLSRTADRAGSAFIVSNPNALGTGITVSGTSVAIAASGSVNISGSVSSTLFGFTGSLQGTASFATSASSAITASYVKTAQTASYVVTAQTASYVVTAQTASYVLQAVSASFATSASSAITASYVKTAQTASYVVTAQTASYVLQAVSASYATVASNSIALNGITSSGYVKNTTDTYTSTAAITDMITLTSAEYAAIATPSSSTMYVIVG
jgi:hypothetical protein